MPKFLDAGSSGQYGWHSTEVALRCPRLFAYHFRMGGKAPGDEADRPALLKGSLVHQGLAHHYLRRKVAAEGGDAEEWAIPEEAIVWCAKKLGHHADKYVEEAVAAVRAYTFHWGHERLDVLNVEEVARTKVAKYDFTQRFDLVVREPDGKIYIYDHKTTGRLSKSIAERYTLSGQFLGMQMFGAGLFGEEFGGVKINFIELPDDGRFKFARQQVDPAPSALQNFPLTIIEARARIESLDESELPPEQWPQTLSEQTCITAYGRCDFFERCRWGA